MDIEEKDLENALYGAMNQSTYLYIPHCFFKLLGMKGANILAELISLRRHFKTKSGWFWRTHEQIESILEISAYQQNKEIDKMIKIGLIEKRVKGLPARTFYKIDIRKIIDLFSEYEANRNLITSSKETKELGDQKLDGIIKKDYKEYNIKKIYKKSLEDIFYYHLFPTECTHLSNEVFTDAWEKFCKYRAQKKWTERAARGIIFTQKDRPKTLIRYEPIIAAKMLLRSINKKWTGVFEIDDQKQSDKGIIQDAYPDISSIFRFNCRKGTLKLEEELRTLAYKFGTWYIGVESQSPGIWKKLNYGTFKTSSLLATRYEMWLGEPEQDWFKAPWYPKALWPTGEMFRKFIDDLNTRFGNLDLTAFVKRED